MLILIDTQSFHTLYFNTGSLNILISLSNKLVIVSSVIIKCSLRPMTSYILYMTSYGVRIPTGKSENTIH